MGLGQRPQVLGPTATRMGGVGWRLRGVGAMAKDAVHGEKGPRGKQGKGPRSVWNLGGRQRHPTGRLLLSLAVRCPVLAPVESQLPSRKSLQMQPGRAGGPPLAQWPLQPVGRVSPPF